jgi:hypothetical protein
LVFDLTFSLAAFSDRPAALWRRSCEEGEEVPSWARMRRAVGEEVEEEGGMRGFWVMKTEPWGDDGSVEGAAGKRVGRRERNYKAEEGVSEMLKVRSRREEGGDRYVLRSWRGGEKSLCARVCGSRGVRIVYR